jgi:hypothetical protein
VGPKDAEREISVHDAMVQFFLAALVIAVAAFFLYFWPHGIGDE